MGLSGAILKENAFSLASVFNFLKQVPRSERFVPLIYLAYNQ